eukprot:TRINITY_DN9714_c0_g1_i2.p1 TRINITY_DN9714_c0_g1~~TRINITY_DN9714_c0_g1_i2.p1  ORF type:complete len:339 (-),score=81.14 TRINITY_DN9714_c0_g1_i2:213-1229(-)
MEKNLMLPRLLERSESCPPSPCHNLLSSPSFAEDWSGENLPLLSLTQESPVGKSSEDSEECVQQVSEPEKTKAKKGRKKKTLKTVAEEDKKKEMRAAKNRQFAKESRYRKRKYIEYLEAQVVQLKQIVEAYRLRLGKYELIEKYSDVSVQSCFAELDSVFSVHPSQKSSTAKNYEETQRRSMEERHRAMEMLTKKLLEVAFSVPLRVSLWLNDNNVDFKCPEKVGQLVGPTVPLEQLKTFKELICKPVKDESRYKAIKDKMLISWGLIKSLTKEFIICERKIQEELRRVSDLTSEKCRHNCDPMMSEVTKKIMSQLALRPEIVNYGEYLIKIALDSAD